MKYMNVPFFENVTPICSFLLGFKVGKYASFNLRKHVIYTKLQYS